MGGVVFPIFRVRFGAPKLPKTKKKGNRKKNSRKLRKNRENRKQIGKNGKHLGKVVHPDVRKARERPPALSLLAAYRARKTRFNCCGAEALAYAVFFFLILFLFLFLLVFLYKFFPNVHDFFYFYYFCTAHKKVMI